MTGHKYLVAALYHVDASFASLNGFLRKLPSFADLPYEHLPLLARLDSVISSLRAIKPPINQERALQLLLAEDLSKVRQALGDQDLTAAIAPRSDLSARLHTCHAEARSVLQRYSIDATSSQVFVVGELPRPYHDRGLSALTTDIGDQEAYGIEPGLYLLASDMTPFYSEQLLCHELIHVVLGARSPELIGRGLEEGIAELLGVFHIGQELLGPTAIRNIFIYSRLSDNYDLYWEQYLDWTRAALLLHRTIGTTGLYELLSTGRSSIKQAEQSILHGSPSAPLGPQGASTASTWTDLAEYLCLSYPRSMVVSPLAKYVVRFVSRGASVTEIAEMARIGQDETVAALQELQDASLLLLLDAERQRVSWSDCEMYADSALPRYRV